MAAPSMRFVHITAIRKMTSAAADRLGLRDRGLLRAGCYADVVTFDPATVGDRATFADPHRLSTGVRDVWVNGARVVRDGAHTGATPGRFVAGPGRP
jgi:dihydroorotase/N-acyl-D-amino-acid deacylase